MNWSHLAQAANDVLAAILIIKLLFLRVHTVYRIFCVFLLFQLFGSLIAWIEQAAHNARFDYRVTWIPLEAILWILSLWTVYELLKAILARFPGILRLSKRLLNFVFLLAIGIGLWSAKAEYSVSTASKFVTPLDRAVGFTLVLDRAICTAALIVLVMILAFVFWFPVQMPRNLAVFSIGFVVYFAARTALLLAWSFWSNENLQIVSDIVLLTLSVCYAYWAIFITGHGEKAPVRVGHIWHPSEQERLIGQLEAMNASLLRAARR